ncbi:forkhead box protein D1-like [Rhopilema esculentum]|uniref:forkhead box protein D1-like n=1 Tax=Rhopilema esculentum TaxID=499914 RepID=UPI0031D801E7|eukprot:gene3103-1396_t
MSSTNFYTSALLATSSNRIQREIPSFESLNRPMQEAVEEERPTAAASNLHEQQEDKQAQKKEEHSKNTPTVSTSQQKQSGEEHEENNAGSNQQQGGSLPSYTAMIAQAILSKEGHRSTLSDIYEFMSKTFPALERRGTGWRNCVRHTLSLNDCFIKLHRPENGRSCNWAVHPTYFESFSRGDYRKRRSIRKRARTLPWLDSGIPYPMQYFREEEYAQHQPGSWQLSPSNGPSWNPQQAFYNQPHSTYNQPVASAQDYRQAYFNSHASCHYMDPNCYCFNQKGTNRYMS